MRHRALQSLIVVFFLCLFSDFGFAAPKFDAEISSNKTPIDRVITLTIRATWPKDEAKYIFSFPAVEFKNLEINQQGESQERFIANGAEYLRKIFTLNLIPLELGRAEIPNFDVTYVNPGRQEAGIFTYEGATVRVTHSRESIESLLWIVLGSATILLVCLGLFFVQRRKRAERRRAELEPSPEQVVWSELKSIVNERADKSQDEMVKDWTKFLKKFLIEYFHLTVERLTEHELLQKLREKNVPRDEIQKVEVLFIKLHEIKFSGMILPEEEFNELRDEVTRYVESHDIVRNQQSLV